ncbi:MAG: BrnT family toxin [Defluviitaleaceae bacterium]|nr:BrnT family toxin [Defluviitaleaceae bacterium]
MRFEWDSNKNAINKAKHNVSFEIAESVFDDKNAVYLFDSLHSADEDRFIVIGKEDTLRMEITVCHCYRGENEDIIRIISARKATKKEVNIYISGGAKE